jgi:hypothetical protein
LAADGRSVDTGLLNAWYGDDNVTGTCDSSTLDSLNFSSDAGWSWPGDYDFMGLDAELNRFLTCANANVVTVSKTNIYNNLAKPNQRA